MCPCFPFLISGGSCRGVQVYSIPVGCVPGSESLQKTSLSTLVCVQVVIFSACLFFPPPSLPPSLPPFLPSFLPSFHNALEDVLARPLDLTIPSQFLSLLVLDLKMDQCAAGFQRLYSLLTSLPRSCFSVSCILP